MLVGFHGYGQSADTMLDELRRIPGREAWRLVSVQALHRFYTRGDQTVVASWMTRQDREHAIADNLAYVEGVLDAVAREWPPAPGLVFAGFSQGVAMAFRAAAASSRPVAGAIAVGGDVPPELGADVLARVPAALVCRGANDTRYAAATFDNDVRRLREAGSDVRPLAFDGGHEWSDAVLRAASLFLGEPLT
jgi:predicted esterase